MRIVYLALVEIDVPNACLVHTREMAEHLAAMGHQVTLLMPKPLHTQKWAGVRHVWIRWWGFDRLRQLVFSLASAWRLIRLHRRQPFDALYVREMADIGFLPAVARWIRLPLFVEVNGWLLDEFRAGGAAPRRLAAIERAQRTLLRSAQGILVSTGGNAEKIRTLYAVPSQRVAVQELGTNLNHFAPGDTGASREALGLPAEGLILLFAGSFHPEQDLFTVVDAFARIAPHHPKATLLLIGHGASWDAVRARCEKLGLTGRVIMPGPVPYEQIPQYFRAANIGIITLTTVNILQRNGCFTLKLWDYMAAGLPVLATDLPNTASAVLLKEKVLSVLPEDVHAMEQGLRQLIEQEPLRARLGQSGREYVRSHRSWRRAAEETIDFMSKRLQEPSEQ